jgi:hypothetical protein
MSKQRIPSAALIAAAALLLVAARAQATEQVDFKAAINRGFVADSTPFTPPALPRLVSTTVYTNVGLSSRGSVIVFYQAVSDESATILFSQMVTLNSGETTVTFGKDKTGKVVLTYDASTDTLTAKFTLDLTVSLALTGVTISSTDYGTGYDTSADIRSRQTE